MKELLEDKVQKALSISMSSVQKTESTQMGDSVFAEKVDQDTKTILKKTILKILEIIRFGVCFLND